MADRAIYNGLDVGAATEIEKETRLNDDGTRSYRLTVTAKDGPEVRVGDGPPTGEAPEDTVYLETA